MYMIIDGTGIYEYCHCRRRDFDFEALEAEVTGTAPSPWAGV